MCTLFANLNVLLICIPHIVYHGDPIQFTMGTPYSLPWGPHIVYHGDTIQFTMGTPYSLPWGPHIVYHGDTIQFTMGTPYSLPWGPHIYISYLYDQMRLVGAHSCCRLLLKANITDYFSITRILLDQLVLSHNAAPPVYIMTIYCIECKM